MRRISLIVGLIGLAVWVGFLIHPQVPPEIASLKVGDSSAHVKETVRWLKVDAKDHDKTWWSGARAQHRAGVTYRWAFDVDFDKSGRLIRIEGRSYNDIIGWLDKTYILR